MCTGTAFEKVVTDAGNSGPCRDADGSSPPFFYRSGIFEGNNYKWTELDCAHICQEAATCVAYESIPTGHELEGCLLYGSMLSLDTCSPGRFTTLKLNGFARTPWPDFGTDVITQIEDRQDTGRACMRKVDSNFYESFRSACP